MLTLSEVKHICPSVFATSAKEGVSDRYTFVPTYTVLEKFLDHGWQIDKAIEVNTRTEANKNFQKHAITMLHPDLPMVNGSKVTTTLINSHNRTSGLTLATGALRMICSNGMFVCEDLIPRYTVRHTGNIDTDIIDVEHRIIESAPVVCQKIESFSMITLDQAEQELFAKTALLMKYGEVNPESSQVELVSAPIHHKQLLSTRRREDYSPDLYTTFNKVQENLVRGGLRGRATTGRRMSTRGVTGIDQNVKLNQMLWSLTEQFAALKA